MLILVISGVQTCSPGSSSDPVTFKSPVLPLSAGYAKRDTRFSGTPDPEAGMNYYQNSGTATRVAIAMSDATTGLLMGSGSSITQNIAADRTATIPMSAMVTSVAGRRRQVPFMPLSF